MNKMLLLTGVLLLASSYVAADGNPTITWTIFVENFSGHEIKVGGTVWNAGNTKEIGHCWDLSPDPGYDNGLWKPVSLADGGAITKTTKEIPGRDGIDCDDSDGDKFMAFYIDGKVVGLYAYYTTKTWEVRTFDTINGINGNWVPHAAKKMGDSGSKPRVTITYFGQGSIKAEIM